MFKSLYIHNFKCIKDLTVNFTYDCLRSPRGYKESQDHIFFEIGAKKTDRVVPVFTLYGTNASGKSSIIEAISNLKSIINDGVNKDCFIPNKITNFDKDEDRTSISLEFYCNRKLCSFSLSFNASSIFCEDLKIDGDTVYCINNSKLIYLNRTLSKFGDGIKSLFSTQCVNALNHHQENSLLGKLRKNYPGVSYDLVLVCDYLLSGFIVVSKAHELSYLESLEILSNTYDVDSYRHRRELALADLVLILRGLDLGIKSISITDYDLRTFHETEDRRDVEFKLEDESEGTKKLILKLMLTLYALRSGCTILVDDLDDSLHPFVAVELIRLFKSKRVNPKKSQLICAIHDTESLEEDFISPYELGLVSYSKKDGAVVNRASQTKGSDEFASDVLLDNEDN